MASITDRLPLELWGLTFQFLETPQSYVHFRRCCTLFDSIFNPSAQSRSIDELEKAAARLSNATLSYNLNEDEMRQLNFDLSAMMLYELGNLVEDQENKKNFGAALAQFSHAITLNNCRAAPQKFQEQFKSAIKIFQFYYYRSFQTDKVIRSNQENYFYYIGRIIFVDLSQNFKPGVIKNKLFRHCFSTLVREYAAQESAAITPKSYLAKRAQLYQIFSPTQHFDNINQALCRAIRQKHPIIKLTAEFDSAQRVETLVLEQLPILHCNLNQAEKRYEILCSPNGPLERAKTAFELAKNSKGSFTEWKMKHMAYNSLLDELNTLVEKDKEENVIGGTIYQLQHDIQLISEKAYRHCQGMSAFYRLLNTPASQSFNHQLDNLSKINFF